MKKKTQTIALFAVLSLAAVGCQKENVKDFANEAPVSETSDVYMVFYSVDGVEHRITLHGESEYQTFIHEMAELAKRGHRVVVRDENRSSQNATTKEVIQFSTNSQEEAETWMDLRVKEGYSVSMAYDEKTGMYNCLAWK